MKKACLILVLVLTSVACRLPNVIVPTEAVNATTQPSEIEPTETPAPLPPLNMETLSSYEVFEFLGYQGSDCIETQGKELQGRQFIGNFKNGKAIFSAGEALIFTQIVPPDKDSAVMETNPFTLGVTVRFTLGVNGKIYGSLFVSNCEDGIYTWLEIPKIPGIQA